MGEPDWNDSDRAEVRQIAERLRVEYPAATDHHVRNTAVRSYFSRTGRVSSHGLVGYEAGCRCRDCRQHRAGYDRMRRAGVS